MGRAARASAVVGALILAGCGGGASSGTKRATSTIGDAAGPQALDCGSYINTQPPPTGYRVVLGVVALPAAPKWPALQTSRSGLNNHAERLFAKGALIIRAGSRSQLVVPAGLTGRLSIGWATTVPQRHRVIVDNCRPRGGSHSGWLAYAGGFWLPHPACVSLLVEAHSLEQRVPIGLGTPCAGQKPPQGPTAR